MKITNKFMFILGILLIGDAFLLFALLLFTEVYLYRIFLACTSLLFGVSNLYGSIQTTKHSPTPKYKVGDYVEILDGSEIENYLGTWISEMKFSIGLRKKIVYIVDWGMESIGYILENDNRIYDERGLKIVMRGDIDGKENI